MPGGTRPRSDTQIVRSVPRSPSGPSVALGLTASVLLALFTPYSDLVMQGTWIGLTSFPISAFFVLCTTLLIKGALGRSAVKWDRTDCLVVYSLALVSSGIPSFGWTGLLIPYIAGPFYFATPENRWAQILQPRLPSWLHPQRPETFIWLYQGLPKGVPIPWADWITPLFWWTVLAISVSLVFFSLSAFLRGPWVEKERLVFPLVHLPLRMTETGDDPTRRFFYDPLVRLTALLAFSIHSLNGLHRLYPWLPTVNVHLISLDPYLSRRPWSAVQPLWIRIPFSIIGLSFLQPVHLSFSLVFFYFFFVTQQVLFDWLGIPVKNVQAYPVRDFVAHQMIGGILLYSFYVLAVAVGHWRRQKSSDPHLEDLTVLQIALGFLAGFVITCLWGWAAGGGLLRTAILFLLFYLLHIIAVRLVCEAGMLYVQHPFRPINILLALFGSERLGSRHLPILVLFDHLLMLDNRSPLMPSVLQGLRLGDEVALSRRRLLAALFVSATTAMLVSCPSYIFLMYRYGGHNLHQWFTTYYTRDLYCTWTAHLITAGEPPNPKALGILLVGATSMAVLVYLHRQFVWFPLAPVGYLMGASWPMINFWFPILIGWLVKAFVVHYGGGRFYRRLVNPFVGLIFGEFFCAGFWVLVDLILGVRGHTIFSF